jgi:hypothetical protein
VNIGIYLTSPRIAKAEHYCTVKVRSAVWEGVDGEEVIVAVTVRK